MNVISQNTHLKASEKFIGKVISIEKTKAVVQLKITDEMVVDNFGLSHGSFTFGLADYAAMVLINKPNVVLGKAEVKFIKPTVLGNILEAIAVYKEQINEVKSVIEVSVLNEDNVKVFEGEFVCFSLENHVLKK